jgi:hypothetical protein
MSYFYITDTFQQIFNSFLDITVSQQSSEYGIITEKIYPLLYRNETRHFCTTCNSLLSSLQFYRVGNRLRRECRSCFGKKASYRKKQYKF